MVARTTALLAYGSIGGALHFFGANQSGHPGSGIVMKE
jgi:hypothetical protein